MATECTKEKEPPMPGLAEKCAALVAQAIFQADEFMRRDLLVLQAQDVLVGALLRLRRAGAKASGAAAKAMAKAAEEELREASVFREVHRRVEQYALIQAAMFTVNEYTLRWEESDSRLWLHAPLGKTWFEVRAVMHSDSPLSKVFVPLNELDLQPHINNMLVGAPSNLGDATRHLLVMRTLLSVLVFRVEVITEIMRYVNTDVGFLAEHVSSTFPMDPALMPPKSFWNLRVNTEARTLIFPCGGGKPGTLFMQHVRVDAGVPAPEFAVKFFVDRSVREWVDSVRTCAETMSQEGNIWNERWCRDSTGFYGELAQVEAAAELRRSYSLTKLPGREFLDRAHGLLTTVAQKVPVDGESFSRQCSKGSAGNDGNDTGRLAL